MIIPNLAAGPNRTPGIATVKPQQTVKLSPTQAHKFPATLGQLSGNGGIASESVNGFGGFDPITGIANGVVPFPLFSDGPKFVLKGQYGNINPQFFAAYNAALAATNTPSTSNKSTASNPSDPPSLVDTRRVLNPLAPPFMFFHPFQLAYPPTAAAAAALHPPVFNRHDPTTSSSAPTPRGVPVLPAWYPAAMPDLSASPSAGASSAHPFPAIPPAPADFASPIPLGPMVAMQSLVGFPHGGQGDAGVAATAICWDPIIGMFRPTGAGSLPGGGNASSVFEQNEAGSN